MRDASDRFSVDELVLLRMMGLAFIEIRMPQKEGIQGILADVYHNVPSGLAHGRPPEVIMERLKECAKRRGVLKYIESVEARVRKSL